MKIGLDAGHGGLKNGVYQTAGKRSLHPVDGEVFYEGVNNRLYAKEWGEVLTKLGHEVVYIVDPNDPTDVSLSTRVTIANSKNLDLLVSIHSNAARLEKGVKTSPARGYGVYISPNASKATHKYANAWMEEMSDSFPILKNRGKKERLFTMVHKTRCPAILLELEFHTNDDAVRLLRSCEFRFKTSLVLSRAIK
jgi:N-acetylmuramoyl-L-alanine amidase